MLVLLLASTISGILDVAGFPSGVDVFDVPLIVSVLLLMF